jgi:hypothetical protein
LRGALGVTVGGSAAAVARRVLVPLVGLPPLAVLTAACAGAGASLLPGVVELCADVLMGSAGATHGAVLDTKRRVAPAPPPATPDR